MARRSRRMGYSRERLDREFEKNTQPKARTDHVFALGGEVSEAEGLVSSVRTEYQIEDEEHNPRRIEYTTTAFCSNGHALSEQNRIAGRCTVHGCQRILCSARGCGCYSCMRCGRCTCREHSVFHQRGEHVEIYCTRLRCRLSSRVRSALRFWFGSGE